MVKFGVSIYSVSRKIMSGEWSAEQGIRWLAEIGAEAIELVPFGMDFLEHPELIDTCLQAAAVNKVKIDNYSLNANFLQLSEEAYEAELKRVKLHMDAAGKLGVPTMRVDCAGFRRPMDTNTTANFVQELPLIVWTYQELCTYAKPLGVQVLLENHGFHVNGAERTAFIHEAMKGWNFGGQLDCGNYICVDDIPEVAIQRNLHYATTIHMKDFYMRPKDHDPGDASEFDCSNSWFRSRAGRYLRGSILGQGDLDIRQIVRTIKTSGFDGNIYIEYEGMEDCLYGTKVSLSNLKRFWAEA